MNSSEYYEHKLEAFGKLLSDFYTDPIVLMNMILLAVTFLPVILHFVINRKKNNVSPPKLFLIFVFLFSVVMLMCFSLSFFKSRLVMVPEKAPVLWYLIWALLFAANWFVWIAAFVKKKDPTSMVLPMFLPWVLLSAVAFVQGNLYFAWITALISVVFLIKKGAENV